MPANSNGGSPPISLDTLLLDSGIRSIYFFNGRLLTGEDLTQEQAANRQGRFRLGQALGSGVAWGLDVESPAVGSTTITVKKGLAVNRMGQELWLNQDQAVQFDAAVAASSSTGSSSSVDCFAPCQSLPSATFTRSGLYVLAISPGQTTEDRAPVSGLGSGSNGLNCNFRYRVDAVKFRRASIPMDRLGLSNLPNNYAWLRNRTAYAFYSNSGARQGQANPFANPPTTNAWTGGVDPWALLYNSAGNGLLSDCDVPLALLYYTDTDGLKFVDMWSVRRRVTDRSAQSANWAVRHSDAVLSESESAWLQFQDHLTEILPAQRPGLRAAERFQILPPAGFLPVGGGQFNWETFLGIHAPTRVINIEAGLIRELLERSFSQDPFKVEAAPLAPVRVYSIAGPEQNDQFVFFARTEEARMRVFLPPGTAQTGFSVKASSNDTNLELKGIPLNRTGGSYFQIDQLEANSYGLHLVRDTDGSMVSGSKSTRAGQIVDFTFVSVPTPVTAPPPVATVSKEPDLCIIQADLGTLNLPNTRLCVVYASDRLFPGPDYTDYPSIEVLEVNSGGVVLRGSNLTPGRDYKMEIGDFRSRGRSKMPSIITASDTQDKFSIPIPGELTKLPTLAIRLYDSVLGYNLFAAFRPKGGSKAAAEYSLKAGLSRKGYLISKILQSDIPWAGMEYIARPDPATIHWMLAWQDYLISTGDADQLTSIAPRLYVNPDFNLTIIDQHTGQATGKKQLEFPSYPQAFISFGVLGLPLTLLPGITKDLKPILLKDSEIKINGEQIDNLVKGGILTVDQLAGAWIDVVQKITGMNNSACIEMIKAARSELASR